MAVWTKLTVVSTSTIEGNEEMLRYSSISHEAIFQAQGRGFVRLRIERDGDLDGVAEDVSFNPGARFCPPHVRCRADHVLHAVAA